MRSLVFSKQTVATAALLGAHGLYAGQPPRPTLANSGQVRASQANLLDINTASAAELTQLPGMGAAYAKRVIEGRPYTAKNQLVTRGILPQEAYDRIRDLIVAHHLPKAP